MKNIIEKLIKIADDLDQSGDTRASDEIDLIIVELAPECGGKNVAEDPEDIVGQIETVEEKEDGTDIYDKMRDYVFSSDDPDKALKDIENTIKSIKEGLKEKGASFYRIMGKLSKVSDKLDRSGHKKAANDVDNFIKKIADKYDHKKNNEKIVKTPKDKHSSGPGEHVIEEYRPSGKTLSTRHCPDHIGVQMTRVSDAEYQCPIDGKVYNWHVGWEDVNGKSHPGGSISEQTPNSSGYFAIPMQLLQQR